MKTRSQVIKDLQTYASQLAEHYGFTEMEIGEDRQKGVWGEGFTSFLEKKYGECTKEVRWMDKNDPGNYVEFRFRFQNPCVCISLNGRETLAECEVGSGYRKVDGKFEYDNAYRPHGFTAWGEGCLELSQKLKDDIENITMKMTNEFVDHEAEK